MASSSLPVLYSTPRAEAVADFVSMHYDLPGSIACKLLRRGFNDTFEVRTKNGERFIFRISTRRARGDADVASETAFLAHLDSQGIPVAAAIPMRDGSLFTSAFFPEGQRPAVLFRYAEGRPSQAGSSAADARANTTPSLRCRDPWPAKRSSSISTMAVRDIWLTMSRYFSGVVLRSGESNTHSGTPSLKAIARYAKCRLRILKPCIFSFPSVTSGLWGSMPVVSTNGAGKPRPLIGSPHSWISCCRGKRRNWRQGCSEQIGFSGAKAPMSLVGTFLTCRRILTMSVDGGRPEVAGRRSKRRF